MSAVTRALVAFPLSLLLGAAALAGCSGDPGGKESSSSTTPVPDPNTPEASSAPTFHKDVEPILQKSCMGCHSTGNIAPFSLTKYEDAKAVAGLIAAQTRAKQMPPWGAQETAECTPRFAWKADPRLSEEEIKTLEAWNEGGALEGDAKDAPPAYVAPSPDLAGQNVELVPSQPFVASGDQDQFRCFILDPNLTEDSYLNGFQIVPGNAKVVHHAVMLLDTQRATEKLAGPDGSFDCFNLPQVPGSQLMGAWAPGADPLTLPEGVGMSMPKGSLVVMQIHYHPAGTTADPDTTRFQLRVTKEKPKYGYNFYLLGNFDAPVNEYGFGLLPDPEDTKGVEFLVPANSKHHVETMQFTYPALDSPVQQFIQFPAGAHLYGSFAHMHYIGRDMKISISRAAETSESPKDECLLQTPDWDFAWQRSYIYDAEIDKLPTIGAGDVVTFRCSYDNSTDNPDLVRALKEAKQPSPIDVHYGEGSTLDEMCIGGIPIIYPLL